MFERARTLLRRGEGWDMSRRARACRTEAQLPGALGAFRGKSRVRPAVRYA